MASTFSFGAFCNQTGSFFGIKLNSLSNGLKARFFEWLFFFPMNVRLAGSDSMLFWCSWLSGFTKSKHVSPDEKKYQLKANVATWNAPMMLLAKLWFAKFQNETWSFVKKSFTITKAQKFEQQKTENNMQKKQHTHTHTYHHLPKKEIWFNALRKDFWSNTDAKRIHFSSLGCPNWGPRDCAGPKAELRDLTCR